MIFLQKGCAGDKILFLITKTFQYYNFIIKINDRNFDRMFYILIFVDLGATFDKEPWEKLQFAHAIIWAYPKSFN